MDQIEGKSWFHASAQIYGFAFCLCDATHLSLSLTIKAKVKVLGTSLEGIDIAHGYIARDIEPLLPPAFAFRRRKLVSEEFYCNCSRSCIMSI
jgi:hypothetical protein